MPALEQFDKLAETGCIDGEIAIGVPLSATGKSIFFDR